MRTVSVGWLAALVALPAPTVVSGAERRALAQNLPPSIAHVRELGPVRFVPAIRGRDGGFSARIGDRSVWVFGDTPLAFASADGTRWRSSTWCWMEIVPRNRLECLHEPVDAEGAPGEFLPFDADELNYNAEHNRDAAPPEQRSRWALWPGPLVVDPERRRALVFYQKVLSRAGAWSFDEVGASIAVWDDLDRAPVRRQLRDESDDPTLLFPKGDAPLGSAAVAVRMSIYAYGCEQDATMFRCLVARAPLADALRRGAWEFFAGGDRWTDEWRSAAAVMNAAPMLSVHWNDYLARYLAVYSTPLVNTIEFRTAARPEGPWSAAQKMFTGRPPAGNNWDYCGMAHPELARERGRIEYITYCRDVGSLTTEIRAVEVAFK